MRSACSTLVACGVLLAVFASPAAAAPPLYVPWPCGVTYNVTQGHNMGSHTGTWNAWAWDFGIPAGADVVAPAAGTVRAIRMSSTRGGCDSAYASDANYVVVAFGDGTEAAFTHLQANSSSLQVGDAVAQGQVVGKVGLSGWVCGAHLHFSINQTCSGSSCPTIQGSFVGFGDPAAGTSITSNNCPAPPFDESHAAEAHLFDQTDSDLDGDGRADLCGRAAAGIRCRLSSGSALSAGIDGPELSDASGWGDLDNYSTLRMADVTGDGLADLCARATAGFRCWPSTGAGFGAAFAISDLTDSGNWDEPEYYTTIRMGDVDGDGRKDLCARGGSGIRCWRSTGTGFAATAITGPPLSDANGWAFPEFYTTIRMGDVNGDGRDDLCARSSDAYHCWLSDGSGFPTLVDGPAWSDAAGWTEPRYYRTIRLADIDGDGDQDVCARTATEFRCHRWNGSGFGGAVLGPELSNSSGWGDASNYATIRMGDLDGDGRDDLCARANAGVRCWKSTGSGFGGQLVGPAWADADGWNAANQYLTMALADVDADGLADVCGRTVDGFECWRSSGDGFPTRIPGPGWSDASGWGAQQHYSTLRIGGGELREPPCVPESEACDGLDNDCNGEVDEGGVCDPPDTDPGDVADPSDADDTVDPGDVAPGDTEPGDTTTPSDTSADMPGADTASDGADTATLGDAPSADTSGTGGDTASDAADATPGADLPEGGASGCACRAASVPQRTTPLGILIGLLGVLVLRRRGARRVRARGDCHPRRLG